MRRPRLLCRDACGAALMEFAIVAPVLMLFIIGGFDAGHTLYVKSVLDGEMQRAARDTSLEDAASDDRRMAIQERVRSTVRKIMAGARVDFDLTSYHDYRDAQRRSEEYTDGNGNGRCDANEAYVDANNNGRWDADSGQTGVGGSKDVVLMTATVRYPPLLITRFIQGPADVKLSATTLLRNQPANDQAAAPQRNCP